MAIQVDNPLGTPGGGKFDAECEALHEKLQARGVLLLVVGQTLQATGMSATGDASFISGLPDLLEFMAKGMRAEQKRGRHP